MEFCGAMHSSPDKQLRNTGGAGAPGENVALGLRREFLRLGGLLENDEDWRALQQLEEREKRGEPLQTGTITQLRGALVARLASNSFFLARVKLYDALLALGAVPEPAELEAGDTADSVTTDGSTQSGQATAFRTNVKIKVKPVMLNGVAVGSMTALAAAASASTLLEDDAEIADESDAPPLRDDVNSAVTPPANQTVAASSAPAQPVDAATEKPAAVILPDEQATEEVAVSVSPESVSPEDEGIARLRQFAAWRQQDVIWAREKDVDVADQLDAGEGRVPTTFMSSLGLAKRLKDMAIERLGLPQSPSDNTQHSDNAQQTPQGDAAERRPAPHAVPLHWISGIDRDLSQQCRW